MPELFNAKIILFSTHFTLSKTNFFNFSASCKSPKYLTRGTKD